MIYGVNPEVLVLRAHVNHLSITQGQCFLRTNFIKPKNFKDAT